RHCVATISMMLHLVLPPWRGVTADPQQQSHHQHTLGLEHNLAKVVPALAPQGQARNLERVGTKERPPRMGPLASQAAQGSRDHRLSVIICLINPQMGWKPLCM
ncbi:hypothetical protein Tco_0402582, partial [Tanacetum coccineum]